MTELRWGVLGCASIARKLIPAIASVPGNRVAAVASRSAQKARAFASEHAIALAVDSYEALLSSGEIDVVYNPLPNALHAPWTIRALDAGLPVLCEKPFTVTTAEAREVAAAARRAGRVVAEAFMYRHHPVYRRVAELIADGALGELRLVSSTFSFFLEDRSEVPASAELGGGALRDVGCYPVSLARLVLGEEPCRVLARARFSTVDDTLVGILEFPSGAFAQLSASIESDERAHAEIVGSRGTIVLDSPWFPRDGFHLVRGGAAEWMPCESGDGYQLEVADFARAVRSGEPPRWPVEDAVRNVAVLEALLESARSGGAAAIPALL